MAKLPLRFIPIGQQLGTAEGLGSFSIPEVLGGSCRNVWVDKFARLSTILGYSVINSTAVVTAVGGVATMVRGLFHYTKQSGGILTRQELAAFDDKVTHWELRLSEDGGRHWTLLADEGSTNCNRIPSFAQAGNTLIICNGVMRPQSWNGVLLRDAGDVAQLAAPTVANAAVVGLLDGTYYYRVRPVRTDGSRLSASISSLPITISKSQVNVGWGAHPDLTVAGYEVHRTTGTDRVFFYEGFVSGRTTVTYRSNLQDGILLQHAALDDHGDAPPVGSYFCFMHKQRMMYSRTDVDPRKTWYADVGFPESVFQDLNSFDCTDAESWADFSTGGSGDYKGMAVLWLEKSVWTVSGDGQVTGAVRNWNLRRTDADTGSVSQRAVVKIPAGATYTDASGSAIITKESTLAYLSPLNDIRLFDGNNSTVISFPKQDLLATIAYPSRAKSWAMIDPARGLAIWVVPAGNSPECSVAVVWDYRHGGWSEFDWPLSHGILADTATDAQLLMAGESSTTIGGFVYRLWDGFTFNGTAISWLVRTRPLYGIGNVYDGRGLQGKPFMSFTKRWRWVDSILKQIAGTTDVYLGWLAGEGADIIVDEQLLTADNSLVEDADGNLVQSTDDSQIVVADIPEGLRALLRTNRRYYHARSVRLQWRGSQTVGQTILEGANVAYQVLVGLKRGQRRL